MKLTAVTAIFVSLLLASTCMAQGTTVASPSGAGKITVLIPLNRANPALIAELLGGVAIYDITGPGAGGAPLGRRARSGGYGGYGDGAWGYTSGPTYGGYTGYGYGSPGRAYTTPYGGGYITDRGGDRRTW